MDKNKHYKTVLKMKLSSKLKTSSHLERSCFCNCCLKKISSKSKLKRHRLLHIGMNNLGFINNNGIKVSDLVSMDTCLSDNEKYICFLCCKHFRTSFDKNNHMNIHCVVKFQQSESFKNNFVSCAANILVQVLTKTIIWSFTVV